MGEDTVVEFRQPGSIEEDPLTEVLRAGARQLLVQAVEAEVTSFVEAHGHLTDAVGRRRIVRHGYLPEREIQSGRLRCAARGCATAAPGLQGAWRGLSGMGARCRP